MDKFYDTNAPCITLNDSLHAGFLVIFSLGTLPLFPSQKTDVSQDRMVRIIVYFLDNIERENIAHLGLNEQVDGFITFF